MNRNQLSISSLKDILSVYDSTSLIGSWLLDVDTGELYWSERTYRIHEVTMSEPTDVERAIACYLPEYRELVRDNVYRAIASGQSFTFEAKIKTGQGREKCVLVNGRVQASTEGVPKTVFGLIEDITDQCDQLLSLRQRMVLLSTVLDNLHQGAVLLDSEHRVITENTKARAIMGLSSSDIQGKTFFDLLVNHAGKETAGGILHGDAESDASMNNEYGFFQDQHGQLHPVRLVMYPFHYDGGHSSVVYIESLKQEIEHRESVNQVRLQDELTGFGNRTALIDCLKGLPNDRHFVLLSLDINRYSIYYMAHGQGFVDRLILMVSSKLTGCFGNRATYYHDRIDRFTLVIEVDCVLDEGAVLKSSIALVQELFSEVFFVSGIELDVTANIGAAHIKAPLHPTHAISRVETALYDAIQSGFGEARIAKSSHLDHDVVHQYAKERAIGIGIKQQQFTCYVQPQVNKNRQIVGVELLMRWVKGDAVVAPHEFIPIAEHTSLINQLGRIALDNSFELLSNLCRVNPNSDISVSINICPKELNDPRYAYSVLNAFKENKSLLKYLVLEITEDSLMSGGEATHKNLQRLVGLGVRFSIDDFGTGYSNIPRLKNISPFESKIDRSITSDIHSESGLAILRSTVAIAKALSQQVVAEGVENEDHFKTVCSLGADIFQGYLFYQPMTQQAFLSIYQENRESLKNKSR